jgi:iron complex outermembrane receptor protein
LLHKKLFLNFATLLHKIRIDLRLVKHILVLILFPLLSFGQNLKISGLIEHEGLPVNNASIKLNDSLFKTSDKKGRFEFTQLPAASYTLAVSHTGFEPYTLTFFLSRDTTFGHLLLQKSAKELSEVVVSGSREEKARKENHLSVSVASQEFIQRNLSGSLMQTLDKIPGVNAMTIGSGQSKPQIRGLGFNQIMVVEGGVKHEGQQWGADHGLEIDQFASGAVEILKGSASYMYGSDAIGGVVHIHQPKLPTFHSMGFSLNSSYMSNSNSVANSLNFFYRKHKWFFDARATMRDFGDYKVPTERIFVYDYEVNLPGGYIRNSAGRERNLQLSTGRITEKLQTRLSVSNVYSAGGFFANAHGLEPRNVNEEVHDASHRDILLPSQNVNHFKVISNSTLQAGKHTLSWDLAFQQNDREEHSQYVAHGFMPSVYPTDLGIEETLERAYHKKVYSVNARDEIQKGKHKLMFGFNLEHQNNDIGGWGFLIPAFKQWQGGAFVYDKYSVSEKTTLHTALRYDAGKIAIEDYRDWFMSQDAGYLSRSVAASKSFDNINWSIGANHKWRNFDFKANVGTSFRMPLAKELAASGVNYHYFRYEKGNINLAPEKSYQIDLGVHWKNEKLEIELSPFYNYFPNYIYLNPTAQHDRLYGAGNQVFEYEESKVLRYGAESQIKWNIAKTWSTSFAGEYLYNRQLSGAKKGYNLPFTPPPSFLWSLTYSPTFLENAYVTLDVKHALEQNRIVPPEKVTPAYTFLNLSAGGSFNVGHQKWTLNLQATNLMNARYLNHTSFYRLIDLPEMGRNIVVTLKIPVVFAI